MTSRERVRAAQRCEKPDLVPAAFEAVGSVAKRLIRHYGYKGADELYQRYDIDIVPAGPRYIGPPLPEWKDEQGRRVCKNYWGTERTEITTAIDLYSITSKFPLAGLETEADLDKYQFPDPDWFDYSAIWETCQKYPDKAIIIGHEGPFQHVCSLISMDEFMVLTIDKPDLAMEILNRMVSFEIEYYTRCFEAGRGLIDVLRTHDDYGTQISMLFSPKTWDSLFRENTKRLVQLAHSCGAFFQQHSCGSVAPLIPRLIECGVDALEPLQKLPGLEPETLARLYGGKICFHGGIDTQSILPHGSVQDVHKETEKYIQTLGRTGGYILMASQGFEGDVPIENIEALYSVPREVSAC